jgi:hypothetical protein
MADAWESAYKARFGTSKFGDDAIGLFALGLQFGIDDLDSIGAEILMGGGDDKKCDLVYLDQEEGRCVVAQCYVSKKKRIAAPANKASDLNTAITWLLSSPIEKLPDRLRASAAEIRDAIKNDQLREMYIWYVHNLPESKNVATEITAVEHTASTAIRQIRPIGGARVLAREFGSTYFSRLYVESESPILVTDKIRVDVPTGHSIEGGEWAAFQTVLPGQFLYTSTRRTAPNCLALMFATISGLARVTPT